MRHKIIGIFIFTLLIATDVLLVAGIYVSNPIANESINTVLIYGLNDKPKDMCDCFSDSGTRSSFLNNPPVIDPTKIAWKKTNGPGGGKIIDLAINPQNPDIIYTAIYPISTPLLDGGIYKTIDGGITWEKKSNGINDLETWSISMDPQNTNILWVGTNAGEIYKTTDAGETWVRKKEMTGNIKIPLSDTIYTIEIDPFNSNRILAGDRHGNLSYTEDGGVTWETIHTESGLAVEGVISDITFDPNNSGVVYLTSGFFDVFDYIGNGIYKSIDGGLTWTRSEEGLLGKTQFGDLVIDPSDSNVVYAANGMEDNPLQGVMHEDHGYLFRSEDAGETWELIDIGGQVIGGEEPHLSLTTVTVHPENSNKIYVTSGGERIITSEDRGETWELHTDSNIIGIVTFVEYHPTDYNIMYATTYAAGVFKSTDAGATWHDSNGKNITFVYASGFLTDPIEAGTLYSQSFENGFHYSTDYGETWLRGHLSGNSFGSAQAALIVKPELDSSIYVVARSHGNIRKAPNPEGMWTLLQLPDINGTAPMCMSLDASDSTKDLLYAGTSNGRVYKTEDGGLNWTVINNGLPDDSDVRTLCVDPHDENRIYAGSVGKGGRIYVSENKGDSWRLLNDEMTFTTIHAMEINPSNDNSMYAAPWGAGLFISQDGGNSWEEITGTGGYERVFSLAAVKVHPFESNIMYATSRSNCKVIKSYDGGYNWWCVKDFGENEYFRLNSFTFDPTNPERFYVSAWKTIPGFQVLGDLYRFNDNGSVEKITNGLPRAVLDVAINPSHPNNIVVSTHIHGLFQSFDWGQSWEAISSFPRVGVFDIEFFNGGLYAAASCGKMPEYLLGDLPQVEGDCGVYKSIDGGTTWSNLLSEELYCTPVKEMAFADGNIYIATENDAYVSSDETQWQALNVPFKEISNIKVTDDTIYVGTHGGGVYYKEIDGDIWIQSNFSTTVKHMQISVDPTNSDIIYASSFPGGMFKSLNRGETWNEKNFALPSFQVNTLERQSYPYNFVINPHNSSILFLGVFGKGVFMSLDGANTWMPINKGLDNTEVFTVQVDVSGTFLYASTNGGSIYRTAIDHTSPNVSVVSPYQGLYLFNRKIIPLQTTLIFGKVTIEVNATDAVSSVEQVEFYINDKLIGNDTTRPYSYNWTRDHLRLFHMFTMKIVAYDRQGNTAIDQRIVRKFL